MPAHLALEEQFDPYSFVKYIRIIGRAYQRRAIELVKICRLFMQASPQEDQQDAKFKEAILAVDLALRLATEAGKKFTDTASDAFVEAQEKLLRYEESAHPGSFPKIEIAAIMTRAKATDERSLGLFNRLKSKFGDQTPSVSSTLKVNFVVLRSLPDPKPLIVHQSLSARSMTSEVLWNFSRYKDDRRIALRQNPHFYLDLPTAGHAYGAGFVKESTKDFQFKGNDTVYVLVDKPDLGRVYLEAEKRKRIFGNVWMPNNVMIFKDLCGRLEGEKVVGNDIQRHQELFWRTEPDISSTVSSAISQGLDEYTWKPVTDVRDWKELIQRKSLPLTRTSVKICTSSANTPVATNDEASRASDKRVTDASSQRSDVPSATNPTNASSVHVGVRGANLDVPPVHGTDAQFLPRTRVRPTPFIPASPNGHTLGSKPIATPAPSHPMPMPMPSVCPPTPAPAHAHGSPIAGTRHPTTLSPSPLPGHPSKPPATQEPKKNLNVSSSQAPTTSSLSPGTNPSSKPIGVTPIANPNLPTQPLPQPSPANMKPVPKQIRNTKADKQAQDARGPTKSMESSISISTFTHMLKPLASMPGAFPGPEMDVDWIMVSQGPADRQGGNWLKRLFRRPG